MKRKSFTTKQLDYLAESAKGLTYVQISKKFCVTKKTVSSSLEEARKRSGTKNNLQSFALAISREELGIDHEGNAFIPKKEYIEVSCEVHGPHDSYELCPGCHPEGLPSASGDWERHA